MKSRTLVQLKNEPAINQAKLKMLSSTKRMIVQIHGQMAMTAPFFLPMILQKEFDEWIQLHSKHVSVDVITYPQRASKKKKMMRRRNKIDADPVMMSHKGMNLLAGQEFKYFPPMTIMAIG